MWWNAWAQPTQPNANCEGLKLHLMVQLYKTNTTRLPLALTKLIRILTLIKLQMSFIKALKKNKKWKWKKKAGQWPDPFSGPFLWDILDSSKRLQWNQHKPVLFMGCFLRNVCQTNIPLRSGGQWKLFIGCNLCQHLLVCFYWLIYRQLVSSGTWLVFADFTVCLLLGCSGDKHNFPLWYSNQFGNTAGHTQTHTHARDLTQALMFLPQSQDELLESIEENHSNYHR